MSWAGICCASVCYPHHPGLLGLLKMQTEPSCSGVSQPWVASRFVLHGVAVLCSLTHLVRR